QLLRRHRRKPVPQVVPRLVPEHTQRARPGPVPLLRPVVQHMPKKIQVLPHEPNLQPGQTRGVEQVLTLVVRVEKNARPAQTDALETAARAVLAILADERSYGEGEWADAMASWQDDRIRKITKRARGIEWRRAEALPG